jgi:hypothetical protein
VAFDRKADRKSVGPKVNMKKPKIPRAASAA